MTKARPVLAGSMWRLAGLGIDLAAAVGGFTLLGYFADRYWETSPRWTLVGLVFGMVGGMYNLVRSALKAVKQQQEEDNDPDSVASKD